MTVLRVLYMPDAQDSKRTMAFRIVPFAMGGAFPLPYGYLPLATEREAVRLKGLAKKRGIISLPEVYPLREGDRLERIGMCNGLSEQLQGTEFFMKCSGAACPFCPGGNPSRSLDSSQEFCLAGRIRSHATRFRVKHDSNKYDDRTFTAWAELESCQACHEKIAAYFARFPAEWTFPIMDPGDTRELALVARGIESDHDEALLPPDEAVTSRNLIHILIGEQEFVKAW
jgi:hypothetical protein